MFSEQFFDLLLDLGDDWKVDEVKMNFILEEVDIFVSYIGTKAECPASLEFVVFTIIENPVGGVI